MDYKKTIEKLILLIPFGGAFGYFGISEDIDKRLVAVAVALLTSILIYLVQKIIERRKYQIENRNLYPQFDYMTSRKCTDLYIPTMFQNASPARQDEPKFTHKYVSKDKLIPFFLKTAFNEKRDSERFYLILADSGMGKTTFMVNLYMSYISFWNRHRDKQLQIKLYRLGYNDTLDLVKNIKREEAINTILLLDALDEDPNILPKEGQTDAEAFQKRVDEIIECTKNFREVVLTCRTQYFPRKEDDPYELKIQRPDQRGFYTLNKLYISPFDDKEVEKYLNKKYPFWKIGQRKQKRQAAQIVKSSPKLIVRPMLLSYIDLLTEDEQNYETVYAIYDNLIEKWLIREAQKRKPEKERAEFIKNLRKVSEQIALQIYQQQNENGGLFLSKEQTVQVAKKNKIILKPDEVTGKSLLTCDGEGNWKFAHKSIYEFFIAKHAIDNYSFYIQLVKNQFVSLDMAKIFCNEKILTAMVLVKGGTFTQKNRRVTISDFNIGKFQVTQKLYQDVMGENPSSFKGENNPVERVSWYDAVEFCNKLSELEGKKPYYNIYKNKKDPNNENEYDGKKWKITINKESKGYRLPTETEWEYAERGGEQSQRYEYSGSNNIDEVAWYYDNSGKKLIS